MILVAKDITKTYSRRGKNFSAVDSAELFIWSGDFIAIQGESGSGKSTLLSILAGISKPDSGDVTFDGNELYDLNDEELSALRNKRIGYVPQSVACLPQLTVLENVLLAAYIQGDASDDVNGTQLEETARQQLEETARSLLQSLGIDHLSESYPPELSGGELRRVAIARALINNPDLIIADEPTSNLDDANGKIIMELLWSLSRKGSAVLLATHDPRAKFYGDRFFFMKNGVLVPENTGEYGNL